MSEPGSLYTTTAQAGYVPDRLDGLTDWERQLIIKAGQLRASGKRVILLLDGSRIFVFSAEPRGTIALE